jgi:macrolide transport system ATP-binding/permease protein
MVYALRTDSDPLSYVNSVREVVRRADANLPVANIRTPTAEIEDDIHQEIVLADLCSAFALLALTIASVGLYGTMSYTVARRTGEMGIRIALGAQRRAVIWTVLCEVFALAAAGLAISVPTALFTSTLIESFLYGTKPRDPWALGVAVIILLSAALLAGFLPARRAAQIDPMSGLEA